MTAVCTSLCTAFGFDAFGFTGRGGRGSRGVCFRFGRKGLYIWQDLNKIKVGGWTQFDNTDVLLMREGCTRDNDAEG